MFVLQLQLQLVLFKDLSLGVHSMWNEMSSCSILEILFSSKLETPKKKILGIGLF